MFFGAVAFLVGPCSFFLPNYFHAGDFTQEHFSYGFPRKQRAGPCGSYNGSPKDRYPTRVQLYKYRRVIHFTQNDKNILTNCTTWLTKDASLQGKNEANTKNKFKRENLTLFQLLIKFDSTVVPTKTERNVSSKNDNR